jgi:membrane-associated phospholipid phosphatase
VSGVVDQAPSPARAARRAGASPATRRLLGIVVVGGIAIAAGLTLDVAVNGPISGADQANLRPFIDHTDRFASAARLLTHLGSITLLVPIATALSLVLWFRLRSLTVAASPVAALAVAGTATALLKVVTARARPPVALRLAAEGGWSFPSGHAADATALYVTTALVVAVWLAPQRRGRVIAVTAGVVLSAAVAITRLILRVHWPTDVIAGCFLGAAVAAATILLTDRLSRPPPAFGSRRTDVPSVDPERSSA